MDGVVCEDLEFRQKVNRVDIGVRVELPAVIFSHLTDRLYESKIVYRTELFEDNVRTFCMNPNGIVVNENTKRTNLLLADTAMKEESIRKIPILRFLWQNIFPSPLRIATATEESIARLSNMLGGGVIVQRFGDLVEAEEVIRNVLRKAWFSRHFRQPGRD